MLGINLWWMLGFRGSLELCLLIAFILPMTDGFELLHVLLLLF
jgi:hypothetical protein